MAVRKAKKAVEATAAAWQTPEPKKPAAKTVKPAAAKSAEAPKSYVLVDHPKDGDIISGLHYAIRVGSSENGSVEISFDGGEWQPCRPAAGYWWFDWGYFTPGDHVISARLRDADGKTIKNSPKVKCTVK